MHEREMRTPAHPTADQRPFSIFITLSSLSDENSAYQKEQE
jgi:hypothetical protein